MPDQILKLAMVGYGKMGRMIDGLAPAAGCEVVLRLDEYNNIDGAGMTPEAFAGIDVAIEFSTPATALANIERLCDLQVNTVVGTTGWGDSLERVEELVAEKQVGLVYGANYSVGVNAFYRIVEAAAKTMARIDEYDCWGYEAHHKMKKDAPSGTMLKLVDVMRQAGYERPIDIATNRVGYVPGTHEFGFDSEADTIEVRHTARGRLGFAKGALRAAKWIAGRKGVYEFSKVWDRMV